MSYEIVSTGDPLAEACATCKGTGTIGDGYCWTCHGDGYSYVDQSSLMCLAHNIAIAAGLCRAFELGLKINGHGWWFPGSGREAPILIGQVDASPVLCEICGAASRADKPCEGCGAP